MKRPPIPTSSYSSFGGSGCLGSGFFSFVYLAGTGSSFFGACWEAELNASTSGTLKLYKSIITQIREIKLQCF